jgi:hypothetical protein
MKNLELLFIFLFCLHVSLFSQTTDVTGIGSIGITCSEYVNNMNRTWNIDIPGNRKVVLDYQVRVEHSYDKILVYSINDSGAAVWQTTLTGSANGRIYHCIPMEKCGLYLQATGVSIATPMLHTMVFQSKYPE